MTKDILKITGIVAVFILVGYLLTYPYEVELPQDDDMVLKGDISKNQSFQELLKEPDLKNQILYVKQLKLGMARPYEVENANKLYEKYKNKNVKFVYIYDSERYSTRNQDYIRQWKKVLNEYPLKGYHFLVSTKFLFYANNKQMSKKLWDNFRFLNLDRSVLVDKKGKIIHRNAPNILSNPDVLTFKLDSLLKIQNNDTIISK